MNDATENWDWEICVSSETKLSVTGGVDAQTSALGYFITPCVGILLSIVCYLSLPHLVSLPLGSMYRLRELWTKPWERRRERKVDWGPQPPSQGWGHTQALHKTDLLVLLQEFARYYLTKKLSQAPAQELETKAELLQAGKPPALQGMWEVQVRSPGKDSLLSTHSSSVCALYEQKQAMRGSREGKPGRETTPAALWFSFFLNKMEKQERALCIYNLSAFGRSL